MNGMSSLSSHTIAVGDLLYFWPGTWKTVPPGLHTNALPLY